MQINTLVASIQQVKARSQAAHRPACYVRKLILFLTLVILVAGAGVSVHKTRAQEPAVLTIQVNGETVALEPGKNVTPEEFALSRDSGSAATAEPQR